jgi:Ca2+-transporting ATPase
VLPRQAAIWAVLQGLAAFAIVALAFVLGARLGMAENEQRALVFTVLVLMNIGLILVNRSFQSSLAEALLRPNRSLWVLVGAVLLVLAFGIYWPPAQVLFHFEPLHWDDLLICVGAGAVLIGLLELYKRLNVAQGGA